MQKSKQHPLPKPLNLVIITDGIPDDIDTFISIISHVSSTLDAGHFPLNQIGIQFVQIGSDRLVLWSISTLSFVYQSLCPS
jgi:hypothetical protein